MIVWLCAAISFLVFSTRVILRRRKSGLPFPPGPPGLPIIGNIVDFPTSNIPRSFHNLAKRYGTCRLLLCKVLVYPILIYLATGPLVYLNVLGRSFVIVDSYDAACELLEKRSGNYSSRPDSIMPRLYVAY